MIRTAKARRRLMAAATFVLIAGCGFVLICASFIPLGIAFFLRLRADLRAGLTLRDIFPPM